MKYNRQKLCLQILLLVISGSVRAQESWPSPEVEQMYHHAREYVARKDFRDAVTTYKQALILAPGKTVLYKELGNALFLSGNYTGADQTLTSILSSPDADAACYQLLAASQAAEGHTKEATSSLQRGLNRFPSSGLLYSEKGKIFAQEQMPGEALKAWLDGLSKDPGFSPNYYDAAITYLNTDKVLWGLLYGEMFLLMAHDTANDPELKSKLFAGYKNMFDELVAQEIPTYGKAKTKAAPKNFGDAVLQVYTSLTPVISDGISTENLTMVRTRFLMNWFSTYNSKYPFSLFAYQDSLIKYGRFDICSEWLFGKAESAVQFDAWNKFHDGAISRFNSWQATDVLHPAIQDGYNDRNMEMILRKKQK